MSYHLHPFADVGLNVALLEHLIARQDGSRLRRLWEYYRNPELLGPAEAGRRRGPRRWAQECGLPSRLTGVRDAALDDRTVKRKEIVIENDIGWRIQAMVDFMFGKPVRITSTARDEGMRKAIERVLDAVWEASGGIALLQDMALLGHVYGHVDLVMREVDAADPTEALRVEVVEPMRGIPLLAAEDYRKIDGYVIHSEREGRGVQGGGWPWQSAAGGSRQRSTVTEIMTALHRQTYQDGKLVENRPWRLGPLPVVHIQNISQPFRYAGMSDVEPLIPLQDELNTRLSDRASRVSLQSFKMYLAKGLDGFEKIPVGPGRLWSTDNMEATVEEFGGDSGCPSEESHIQEVREAMDKTSGVPPLASGVVRAKIGNLTSANALRITLMGVLSKTARKRVTYGRGIAQMSGLILGALDELGLFKTDPLDRGVRLAWPDPLPEDLTEQAALARVKEELGVPREKVLAELGYSSDDAGVN